MRNLFKPIIAWLREVPPTGRDEILPQEDDFDTREKIERLENEHFKKNQ